MPEQQFQDDKRVISYLRTPGMMITYVIADFAKMVRIKRLERELEQYKNVGLRSSVW